MSTFSIDCTFVARLRTFLMCLSQLVFAGVSRCYSNQLATDNGRADVTKRVSSDDISELV